MKRKNKLLACALAVMLLLPSFAAMAEGAKSLSANEPGAGSRSINEPKANAGIRTLSGNEVPEKDVVQYNTGNCVIGVMGQEMSDYLDQLAAEGDTDKADNYLLEFWQVKQWTVFEQDGSYTINLSEPDPFFPYEVEFTCNGETAREWFMTPEDSVEVGGHTFRVSASASADDTRVARMTMEVAGDTIVVYPREKRFTNEGDGTAPASLLPLEEHRLSTVDLSAYTPAELSMVSVKLFTAGGKQIDAEKIAWAYGEDDYRNYDDYNNYNVYNDYRSEDDFTVWTPSKTIDLSYRTGSYGNTLHMIVGDGNQLNPQNVRYIMDVKTQDSDKWLRPVVYTQDQAGRRAERAVTYRNYSDYKQDDKYLYVEYEGLDSESEAGTDRYLGLSVDPSVFSEPRYDHIRAYEGLHSTAGEAMAGKEITGQIWNVDMSRPNAGYLVDGYNMELTLVAFDKNDRATGHVSFEINFYGDQFPFSHALRTDARNGFNVTNGGRRKWNADGSLEYTYTLYKEYPANRIYYQTMDYQIDGETKNEYVAAAYVGKYASAAEAEAAGARNIKDLLFGEEGWPADYSAGVYFTIMLDQNAPGVKKIYQVMMRTETGTESRYANILNSGTAVHFTGLLDGNGNKIEDIFLVPNDFDSYGDNNYRTILVGDSVDLTRLAPLFTTSEGVHLYAPGSSSPEQSGGRYYNFANGFVQFTASAEDGKNGKNFWLQVKKATGAGGELFINSLVDPEAHTRKENGVIYSTREIMLDGYHDYVHDVWVSNIGKGDIPNLTVELDSPMLELDEYWSLDGKFNLAGFSTTKKETDKPHGTLPNLAKVRLRAKEGTATGENISGTLTFKSGGITLAVLNLTGVVGDPCIVTKDIPAAVKYVPYGTFIQNNNKYSWNRVSYYLSGKLPEGMVLKENGEIYGIPKETGEFPFRVTLSSSISGMGSTSKDFVLTVKENTNDNVFNESDSGYSLLTPIGEETGTGSHDFYLGNIVDSDFVSEGLYGDFMDVWLNGERLEKGVDYTSESGSTRITIRSQTLQNKALKTGNNTIAAEFRLNKDENNQLKRTAQNFHLDKTSSAGSGSGNGSGNGSGGGYSSDKNQSGSAGENGGENGSAGSTGGVAIGGYLMGAGGGPVSGLFVELHSTPRSVQTDTKGFFRFANVEFGQHELFVKDEKGNTLASRKFEMRKGNAAAFANGVLTAPDGADVTLRVTIANGSLTIALTGASAGQTLAASSASTGDSSAFDGWLLALLISGSALSGMALSGRKKKAA